MADLQQQAFKVFNAVYATSQITADEIAKGLRADFDLAPLSKLAQSGFSVDELHALITNQTLLRYAFMVVVINTCTVIAGRQSVRGRNPLYTILATLACVFFAPTLFPLLTGNKITWITNDKLVAQAFGIAVVTYVFLRYIYSIRPVRLVGSLVLAAASAGVVAAGWKTGLATFNSTAGALAIAALDSAARPFAVALEAYLVDGSLGDLTVIRSQLFGAIVYGLISLTLAQEKLALVATFAVIATGFVAASLGFPINWFFPFELFLGGSSRPASHKVVEVKTEAKHQQPATPASPNKKKQ
jgi:hypothetical protein